MKHQEFWSAVARGEAEQWECMKDGNFMGQGNKWLTSIYQYPEHWISRRKPRTIVVNGVECQAGYEGEIAKGTKYAIPDPSDVSGFSTFNWRGDSTDERFRKLIGVYIGPDKEAHAGAVGRAMRLPTEAKT